MERINDTARAREFLRSITPPLPPTERRRKWSAALADADGWLQMARKDCKRREYVDSRQAVACAVRALEKAMLYAEPDE